MPDKNPQTDQRLALVSRLLRQPFFDRLPFFFLQFPWIVLMHSCDGIDSPDTPDFRAGDPAGTARHD
jgi:hypothetical protein